ncbi:hypothetical protein ACF0H5_007888 [Mactra antiquata]
MLSGLFNFLPRFSVLFQSVALGFIILVLYYIISTYLRMRRNKKLLAGVKCPEYHWFFGSFKFFPTDPHDRTQHLVDICNKYGTEQGYTLLWGILGIPIIVICSPRLMANICKTNEPKAKGLMGAYRFLQQWLGEGLLVSNGNKWARNRRLLTPAFHFEILKPYTNVFNKAADTLVDKLREKAESGERFETFQNVCLCTLEIILKCAFSYDKDVQNTSDTNPYIKAVYRLTDSLVVRFLNPLYYIDFIWYRSKVGKQFQRDVDFADSVAEEIIERRRETLLKEDTSKEKRYVDFLDILLTAKDEDGKGLSRLDIRNEVNTFLFEGHDTTASGISWVLYSLAQHPEYQKKCQDEIDNVFGDKDDLEWSDLSKLEYLTMCIKEGMRLHPPVPIISRETTKDFDLGDRMAPVGSIVQLNIWTLCHMENVWGSDHMEFKPERFSKDNAANMEAFQYVPFSAGSRNCIGQNFAMNEEKVVLSKLLRNFTFRLDPDHEVRRSMSAVLRTQTGMYMFVEKRNV